MRSVIQLVMALTFCSSTVFAQSEKLSQCADWKNLKPMIQNLKRIAYCGSGFSTKECRENLELSTTVVVGGVALAGAAVGAMAGRNVLKKAPKVCSLFGQRAFFFESVAWAGDCNTQVQEGANSVANTLKESNKALNAELGNYLTEKVAQENPALDEAAKDMVRTFQNNPNSLLTNQLKDLNQRLKPFGVQVDRLGNCSSGSSELCAKLWSLFYRHNPVETRSNIAGNVARLAKYYPADSTVRKYTETIAKTKELITRVTNGLVKSESALEALFIDAQKVTHNAVKGMLADSANLIAGLIPSMAKNSTIAGASSLAKAAAVYVAEHGKYLKKILPLGLASLVGVATGASAEEVTLDAVPFSSIIFGSQIGCQENYSRYAPCVESSRRTAASTDLSPEFIDYLNLPEDLQQNEACNYPTLSTAIRKMSANYFPADLSLTCSGSDLSLESRFEASKFQAQFQFQNEDLTYSRVSRRLDGITGYEFVLDPRLGTVLSGKLTSSRSSTAIKKGMAPETLNGAAEDFSSRQVMAYMGQDCCQSGSADSCSIFRTKSGAGTTDSSPGASKASGTR